MNRRQLLLGCVTFQFLGFPFRLIKKLEEPKLADPIPPGYKEILRCEIKGRQHVIFSKEGRLAGPGVRRWRL